MNLPCPTAIHCGDYPFANLSSEGVEYVSYTARGYCCDTTLRAVTSLISQEDANEALQRTLAVSCPDCDPPKVYCADASCPDGSNLTTKCVPTSQADADALAAAAAAAMLPFCDHTEDLFQAHCACPDGVTDLHTTYSNISQSVANADCEKIPKVCPPACNTEQCCDVTLPDGTQLHYCVPAETVCDASLTTSNAQALDQACDTARNLAQLSALPSFVCLLQSFSAFVNLSGTTGTFTWSVFGVLPTGLVGVQLGNNTYFLSGTPTTPGTYTFTIRVTLGANNYIQRTYTIVVFGFITASDLPDASVGTPYLAQIEADGGSGNYLFEITDGILPDGLLLSPTGFVTGTPTSEDLQVFTVRVQDLVSPTHVCELDFQIDVSKTIYAYYKCDETVGLTLTEEVIGRDMTVAAVIDPVAGIINGGLHMTSINNYAETISSAFFNFAGHDFSIRLWFKLDSAMSYPNSGVFLAFNNWAVGYNIFSPLQGVLFRVNRDGGSYDTALGGVVSPGVWHRVCAWWHHGVQIGIKIDDNPSVTAVPTDIQKDAGDSTLFIASSSLGHSIDEIAIWRDHVLTEDEMTFDWNSGNGRTYPDVP